MDTITLMQKRFWEVKDQHDAILAQSKPLHEQYETLAAQIAALQAKQKELTLQWREAEAPTIELSKELSSLVKALQGKTGERPA